MRMKSALFTVLTIITISGHTLGSSLPAGSYNNGTISDSVDLPEFGDGYMRLFVKRNRGWGSKELVSMIIETASEMYQFYPSRDRLQTGDLGARFGGQISGHGSHQNGLDVDLTYYRNNGVEQKPEVTNGFSELMVKNGKTTANFDILRNWELVKTLHRYGKIQRIFVDPVIKSELCKFAKKIGEEAGYEEVLRSMRPYPNHADHLHVRLYCPEDSSSCIPQEEVPEGSGC